MRRALIGIVGFLLLVGGGLVIAQGAGPSKSSSASSDSCDAPLTYRVADIDPRYEMSRSELKRIMQEVGALWSEAAGRNLIEYHPDGAVAIHLVYSREQQATAEEEALRRRIETRESEYDRLQRRYRVLLDRYEEKRDRYETLLAEYNASIDAYKDDVAAWRSKGETSPQVRNELQRRGNELTQLQRSVNRRQEDVAVLRRRADKKATTLNELGERLNASIARYNRRFGSSREFDQGKYMRQNGAERIEVYQFSGRDDLALVLAHEVGHALGLGHVSNAGSIMHYLRDKQNPFDLTLSDEDVAAIRAHCSR